MIRLYFTAHYTVQSYLPDYTLMLMASILPLPVERLYKKQMALIIIAITVFGIRSAHRCL